MAPVEISQIVTVEVEDPTKRPECITASEYTGPSFTWGVATHAAEERSQIFIERVDPVARHHLMHLLCSRCDRHSFRGKLLHGDLNLVAQLEVDEVARRVQVRAICRTHDRQEVCRERVAAFGLGTSSDPSVERR